MIFGNFGKEIFNIHLRGKIHHRHFHLGDGSNSDCLHHRGKDRQGLVEVESENDFEEKRQIRLINRACPRALGLTILTAMPSGMSGFSKIKFLGCQSSCLVQSLVIIGQTFKLSSGDHHFVCHNVDNVRPIMFLALILLVTKLLIRL